MPPTEDPLRHNIEQPVHAEQPVEPSGSAAIEPPEQQPMQLDEAGLSHGQDDQQIVERLAREFAELAAGADIAMFEGRVETALEQVKAGVPRALLHYLAAEACANAGCVDRAMDHVEQARSALSALGPADSAGISGRIAMLRARLLLSRDEDLAISIEATEEAIALVPPEESPDVMGALAYNAGIRLHRLEPFPPPDSSAFLRAETLFQRALDGYEAAGLAERASDAAENLAALALRRLERGAIGTAKQEIFDEAWRLAERAMALRGSAASPVSWARRNELAAAILRLRPGKSADANARDAIKYLDRALDRYQTGTADAAAAARCADLILGLMDTLPRPWSSDTANRYITYLGVKGGQSNAPAARAAQALAAAEAWARVVDDPAASARHLREYAGQALAAATEAGDDTLSASALILSGNAQMETLQPDGGNASHLAEASALFEKAVASARKCQDVALESQALRQLGVALARRVSEHDEVALLDRTLGVLRQAADASQGSERAFALVNLGSLQLWAARRQEQPIPVDTVKRTIDEAEPLAATDPTAAQGLARLRQDLDEALVLDGLSPVQFDSPPASLGYRRYRTEERPLGASGPVGRVITLLLMADQAARIDGVMKLSESGGEVSAEIEMACPACGPMMLTALPLITSLEGNPPRALDNAQRMARGELRCTSCATPIVVQSFFALEGGVRRGHSIVYPDALGAGPSGILSHQVDVIGRLHQAYLGKPLEATTLLPWGGILAFGTLDAATTFRMRRTLNLGDVVFGLLTGQIEKLRTGLEGCLQSIEADDLVRADEITALNALATASGGPASDPAFAVGVAAQINRLISEARTQGLDVVMIRLRNALIESSATAADIQTALQTAANPNARRVLLRRYLEEAPDYSSDREQAIYDLFLHGAELEMKALLAKGIDRSDPQRFAGASALLAGARKGASEKIAEDRKKNSAAPGKALLAEALDGGRRFVLLLRAFAVDVPIGRPSQTIRKMTKDFSDARIGWRVYALGSDNSGRSTNQVVEWLAPHVSLLMVVNAIDPYPPERAAKLYMTDTEWRTFVFPLIGEAAATVLVLPGEGQPLSGGVMEELAAIDRLSCNASTVIVLANPNSALSDDMAKLFTEAMSAVPAAPVSSANALRKRGYAAVLHEQEIAANPALLIDAVLTLLPGNR